MSDLEFYANCAIAAMQGLMENGTKFSEIAAVLLPKKLANEAFNIADAMLEEYLNRTKNFVYGNFVGDEEESEELDDEELDDIVPY